MIVWVLNTRDSAYVPDFFFLVFFLFFVIQKHTPTVTSLIKSITVNWSENFKIGYFKVIIRSYGVP
jgi:hypothetical protein